MADDSAPAVVDARYEDGRKVSRHRIRVKPGSRKGPLVEAGADGLLTVFVKERAVDGAANEGVIVALAAHWGVRKRDMRIVSGHTARIKTVDVDDEPFPTTGTAPARK